MWGKQFLKSIRAAVFVRSENYEIPNLVLIHMLHVTFSLIITSAIFNPYFGVPLTVIYLNFIAAIVIGFIYWLVRAKAKYKLGRRIYLSFVLIIINFLWLETEGSSGPALFYVVALIPIVTFIVDNRYLKLAYAIIGINVPALLLIEAYQPQWITQYPSDLHRVLDIMSVCFVFIVFEVPLIIYIKNVVISQRNNALHSEKVKTSYITNLSHEIRTPMNAILGFSELLNQKDLQEDERSKFINIINDNGQTLLSLLNNIINISKIEEEQAKVSLTAFSPYNLLKQVHAALSFKANSEVDFRIVVDEDQDLSMESDTMFLYQILSNLTFNALKFTNKGYVHIGYCTEDEYITFFIKDTGIGICQSKHDKLFNQYEQIKENNQLININGTGLGLTICKSLSVLLKGELFFDSEKNIGTTFYLKLPIMHTKELIQQPKKQPEYTFNNPAYSLTNNNIK